VYKALAKTPYDHVFARRGNEDARQLPNLPTLAFAPSPILTMHMIIVMILWRAALFPFAVRVLRGKH
jgi:hypothetical protein